MVEVPEPQTAVLHDFAVAGPANWCMDNDPSETRLLARITGDLVSDKVFQAVRSGEPPGSRHLRPPTRKRRFFGRLHGIRPPSISPECAVGYSSSTPDYASGDLDSRRQACAVVGS